MELKGSRTEANLMAALQENHKQEINIHSMLQRLRKKDMNKLLSFSRNS